MAREKRSLCPIFIAPMAAQPVTKLPEGDDWLYEVKWDGYRALMLKDGQRVQVRSRNDKDFSLKYSSIADAALSLRAEQAALDGEIVALGQDGRPSLQALQHSSQGGHRIVFYAFDVLHLNGRDLTGRRLSGRRVALKGLIPDDPIIRISEALPGTASDIAADLRDVGIEGVIAKRKDSLYQPGERSGDWVKLKLETQQSWLSVGTAPMRRTASMHCSWVFMRGRNCASPARFVRDSFPMCAGSCVPSSNSCAPVNVLSSICLMLGSPDGARGLRPSR